MQITERVYERLTPDERFRAMIEAFSRADWKEADRLNETCPSESVRVQSLAYFGRLRGFQELAMAHGIDARNVMIGVWAALTQFLRLPPQTSEASEAEASEREANPPESREDEDEDEDEIASKIHTLLARLGAYCGAWADFCGYLGVDPDKTQFAYYRESREILEMFDWSSWVEPDHEYRAEQIRRLREMWDFRISRSEVRR